MNKFTWNRKLTRQIYRYALTTLWFQHEQKKFIYTRTSIDCLESPVSMILNCTTQSELNKLRYKINGCPLCICQLRFHCEAVRNTIFIEDQIWSDTQNIFPLNISNFHIFFSFVPKHTTKAIRKKDVFISKATKRKFEIRKALSEIKINRTH